MVAPTGVGRALVRALDEGGGVVRVPPAVAPEVAVSVLAATAGHVLVVAPTVDLARRVANHLRRQGRPVALLPREWAAARAGATSVVGSRAAAWGPALDVGAMVVVDGHDETLQDERTPSWHAVDVVRERARRAGIPAVVLSPCPDLITSAGSGVVTVPRAEERDGWAQVEIADRRDDDPRSGLYGERLVTAIRRASTSILVLNRKGRARLLACAMCGDLARCERCAAGVVQADDSLRCARCGLERPLLCASCGATMLKALRVGVTRAREELEALLGHPVGEITGDTAELPGTAVTIGTEAVLHRQPRSSVDLVAFLDVDQELLAPRYRAAEEALALLARASRVTGGRRAGGRVLVQTRQPEHPVLLAALQGDPSMIEAVERAKREVLGFPPATAMAAVSGAAARTFIERLGGLLADRLDLAPVEVLGPDDGRWLVRAPDSHTLSSALTSVERPPGRLRIEVDPRRL